MANPAPGETSLRKLLASLTTTLHPSTYVFLTVPHNTTATATAASDAILTFRETEGTTLIMTLEAATRHHLEYSFPCRKITLNVQSSLDAVGFLAVITTRLAEKGMGVNPISGFFHDHLFVPLGREQEALAVLADIQRENQDEN